MSTRTSQEQLSRPPTILPKLLTGIGPRQSRSIHATECSQQSNQPNHDKPNYGTHHDNQPRYAQPESESEAATMVPHPMMVMTLESGITAAALDYRQENSRGHDACDSSPIPDTTPHRSPSAASFLRRVGSPAVNRQPSSTYADAASSTVNFTNPPQHVDINGALGKPSVAPRKLNSRNWRQPNYHRKPTQEKKKATGDKTPG